MLDYLISHENKKSLKKYGCTGSGVPCIFERGGIRPQPNLLSGKTYSSERKKRSSL